MALWMEHTNVHSEKSMEWVKEIWFWINSRNEHRAKCKISVNFKQTALVTEKFKKREEKLRFEDELHKNESIFLKKTLILSAVRNLNASDQWSVVFVALVSVASSISLKNSHITPKMPFIGGDCVTITFIVALSLSTINRYGITNDTKWLIHLFLFSLLSVLLSSSRTVFFHFWRMLSW